MCVQIFHMVNIDVPAGVGAPPLNTQLLRCHTQQVLDIAWQIAVKKKTILLKKRVILLH